MPRPLGTAHPLLAPYQVYSTASSPITIGILTQAHWEAFCRLIGREDLVTHPLFLTAVHRIDHRQELNAQIEPVLRSFSAEHWLAAFQPEGLVCGAVNDVAALL